MIVRYISKYQADYVLIISYLPLTTSENIDIMYEHYRAGGGQTQLWEKFGSL